MSSLLIYRASAGSGKTYTIVQNYLALILHKGEYGLNNYKHILAITFTNKATEEMKTRVIEDLVKIAKNQKSDHIDELCKRLEINEFELRDRARYVLTKILHDYSNFNISTLDSFFQKILKSFTRELGLSHQFEESLDTDIISETIVEDMLSELDSKSQLFKHLVNFSQSNIENSKGWNIKKNLINFSNKLFHEEFLNIESELGESIQNIEVETYIKKLNQIVTDHEKAQKNAAQFALNYISESGLEPTDFAGKSRSLAMIFVKCIKSEGLIGLTPAQQVNIYNEAKWASKTTLGKLGEYIPTLSNKAEEILKLSESSELIIAQNILKNIYQLSIVKELTSRIKEYNTQNNSQPICYTPKILTSITSESHSPFIYEKIGSHFHNFMIDEFQDTSPSQWMNLEPLIEESISVGEMSMIVGDIKQAIYGFRGGDWELMSQLTENFPVKELEYNWRTHGNIIEFNNTFYDKASEVLASHIKETYGEYYQKEEETPSNYVSKIYKNQAQKVGKKERIGKGFVGIRTLNLLEKIDNKKPDYDLFVEENLLKDIQQLLAKNYQLKDIAILLRYKRDEDKIVDILSRNGIDFISEKSLNITQSSSIRIIINCLKLILDNKNLIAKKIVAFHSQKLGLEIDVEKNLKLLFNQNNVSYLSIEYIIELFKLGEIEEELIYLQKILDIVQQFTSNKSNSIRDFLKFWEVESKKFNIIISESQNAIRLLTIHKSKGLEFKAVMIPYCNWNLEETSGTKIKTIWTENKIEKIKELSHIPLSLNKSLLSTKYKYEFINHSIKEQIESLNMLYVATTRPKESMFIYHPVSDKFKDVSALLMQANSEFITVEDNYKTIGSIETVENEKSDISNYFKLEKFVSKQFNTDVYLKNSNEFLKHNESILNGNLYHEIFSKINYFKEIETVCENYYNLSLIEDKDFLVTEIKEKIEKYPILEDLFSENWEVKNEASILTKNHYEKRPDRIMINGEKAVVLDYKFGAPSKKHEYQVKEYRNQLRQMGYKDIDAYLWYYANNDLVKV